MSCPLNGSPVRSPFHSPGPPTLRPLALVVAAFSVTACGLSDDAELTSLDDEQRSTLCAETCAGHEPYEIECDDVTYSSDEDEEGCLDVCTSGLENLEDCTKTVGDWRRASSVGPDSSCEEVEETTEAAIRIAIACSDLGDG